MASSYRADRRGSVPAIRCSALSMLRLTSPFQSPLSRRSSAVRSRQSLKLVASMYQSESAGDLRGVQGLVGHQRRERRGEAVQGHPVGRGLHSTPEVGLSQIAAGAQVDADHGEVPASNAPAFTCGQPLGRLDGDVEGNDGADGLDPGGPLAARHAGQFPGPLPEQAPLWRARDSGLDGGDDGGIIGKGGGHLLCGSADHLVQRHLAQGLHDMNESSSPLSLAIDLTLAQTVLERMVSSSSCPSQVNSGDAMPGPPRESKRTPLM